MNPLLLKFGIPAVVLGVLAYMHWMNSKSLGQPMFPGIGDGDSKARSGGGASIQPGSGLHSPNEVTDPGTFDDGGGSFFDDSSTDSGGDDSATTDVNPGTSTSIHGVTAGHPGANVGGVNYGGTAQQQGVSEAITSPYTGGYIPHSSTPTTQPPSNQFGGQGGGGTFAI